VSAAVTKERKVLAIKRVRRDLGAEASKMADEDLGERRKFCTD